MEQPPDLDEEDLEFLIQTHASYPTEYKNLSTGEMVSYRKSNVDH